MELEVKGSTVPHHRRYFQGGRYWLQADISYSLPKCVVVCIIQGMKSSEVIKQLKADGWFLVHVVGSHHQFKHATKPGKVTVPHPKKDLPLPTVRSIFKQAGL